MTALPLPHHASHTDQITDPRTGTAQLPRRIPGQRLHALTATSDIDWFGPGDPEWPTADDLDKAEEARLRRTVNDVAVTPLDDLAVDEQFADRIIAGIRGISGSTAPSTCRPDTADAP